MVGSDIFKGSLYQQFLTSLIGYSIDYLAKWPNIPDFVSLLLFVEKWCWGLLDTASALVRGWEMP